MKKQKQIDELKEQIERMQERIDHLEACRWLPIWVWLPQPYPVPYTVPTPVPSPYTLPYTTDVTGTNEHWSSSLIYGESSLASHCWVLGEG